MATVMQKCRVKWGVSCQQWGRLYDYGLISCTFESRVRSGKPTKIFDLSLLRTDETIRSKLEQVRASFIGFRYFHLVEHFSISILKETACRFSICCRIVFARAETCTYLVSSRTRNLYTKQQLKDNKPSIKML